MIKDKRPRYWASGYDRWHLVVPVVLVLLCLMGVWASCSHALRTTQVETVCTLPGANEAHTIAGQSEPYARVWMYANDRIVGQAQSDANGNYLLNMAALKPGEYHFRAVADMSGVQVESPVVVINLVAAPTAEAGATPDIVNANQVAAACVQANATTTATEIALAAATANPRATTTGSAVVTAQTASPIELASTTPFTEEPGTPTTSASAEETSTHTADAASSVTHTAPASTSSDTGTAVMPSPLKTAPKSATNTGAATRLPRATIDATRTGVGQAEATRSATTETEPVSNIPTATAFAQATQNPTGTRQFDARTSAAATGTTKSTAVPSVQTTETPAQTEIAFANVTAIPALTGEPGTRHEAPVIRQPSNGARLRRGDLGPVVGNTAGGRTRVLVSVYDNDRLLGETLADHQAIWAFRLPDLETGRHNLTAHQTTEDGQELVSDVVEIDVVTELLPATGTERTGEHVPGPGLIVMGTIFVVTGALILLRGRARKSEKSKVT